MKGFHNQRNDPNANKVSNLSPYIHFGQLSAQQMAVEVAKHKDNYRVSTSFRGVAEICSEE